MKDQPSVCRDRYLPFILTRFNDEVMKIQKFVSKNGATIHAISKLERAYFWHNLLYVRVSSNTSVENGKGTILSSRALASHVVVSVLQYLL